MWPINKIHELLPHNWNGILTVNNLPKIVHKPYKSHTAKEIPTLASRFFSVLTVCTAKIIFRPELVNVFFNYFVKHRAAAFLYCLNSCLSFCCFDFIFIKEILSNEFFWVVVSVVLLQFLLSVMQCELYHMINDACKGNPEPKGILVPGLLSITFPQNLYALVPHECWPEEYK